MNLLFIINTPAQAHTWKNVVISLQKNHSVQIIARDYGSTTKILNSFGFKYITFRPQGSGIIRLFGALDHFQKCYRLSKRFDPSMVIGFGIDASITALRLGKPSVVFNDSEPIGIQNKIMSWTATSVITPSCFRKDLGRKQIRVDSYKELGYLHLNYFKPDPAIFGELGLTTGDKYVILRFNVFDAVHDIGKHGYSVADQINLAQELGKYARVFISPEGRLAPELEKYRIPIADSRMHQALYYAQMLVTDTQTMTTEAAILGTPAIRCNNFVGPHDMGNFVELENRYGLIYSFQESIQAIQKAVELLKQPDLKEQWRQKRDKLLAEKVDFGRFMVNYIETFSA